MSYIFCVFFTGCPGCPGYSGRSNNDTTTESKTWEIYFLTGTINERYTMTLWAAWTLTKTLVSFKSMSETTIVEVLLQF